MKCSAWELNSGSGVFYMIIFTLFHLCGYSDSIYMGLVRKTGKSSGIKGKMQQFVAVKQLQPKMSCCSRAVASSEERLQWQWQRQWQWRSLSSHCVLYIRAHRSQHQPQFGLTNHTLLNMLPSCRMEKTANGHFIHMDHQGTITHWEKMHCTALVAL